MEEIWRDIKGYEKLYQVSNLGRVKSVKNIRGNYREKILKLREDDKGYLQINLYKEGKCKTYRVHPITGEKLKWKYIDNK